jgi:hypothetical protein
MEVPHAKGTSQDVNVCPPMALPVSVAVILKAAKTMDVPALSSVDRRRAVALLKAILASHRQARLDLAAAPHYSCQLNGCAGTMEGSSATCKGNFAGCTCVPDVDTPGFCGPIIPCDPAAVTAGVLLGVNLVSARHLNTWAVHALSALHVR